MMDAEKRKLETTRISITRLKRSLLMTQTLLDIDLKRQESRLRD